MLQFVHFFINLFTHYQPAHIFINLFTWLLTCSHGYQFAHMFINPFTCLSTCSHGLSTCSHVYQPIHMFINLCTCLSACSHKTNNPLRDQQLSVHSPSEVSITVADAMNSQKWPLGIQSRGKQRGWKMRSNSCSLHPSLFCVSSGNAMGGCRVKGQGYAYEQDG